MAQPNYDGTTYTGSSGDIESPVSTQLENDAALNRSEVDSDARNKANGSKCNGNDVTVSSATSNGDESPNPNWYIRLLALHPVVVIVVVVIIISLCTGITGAFKPIPDFSDPLKGFSARGTPIYKAQKTAKDILSEYTVVPPSARVDKQNIRNDERRKRSVPDGSDSCSTYQLHYGYAMSTKLVLESSSSSNLLTTAALRGICDFVDTLILPNIAVACPAMSVASRLAELRNKTCSQLGDADVSYARDLLDECVSFYKNDKLKPETSSQTGSNADVPTRCYEADFVYDVMYYFADVGFYDKSHDLKYTIVYIHYSNADSRAYDVDEMFYEDHVDGHSLNNGIVQLVTVGFQRHDSMKYTIFEKYLINDLIYFGLAGLFIAFFTLIYLLSFVLVISTFINILLSFGFAYFLYYYVCQMVFFPFINMIALLLVIAIGADDVFVFYDAWLQVKAEHPTWSRDQRMSATFSHAITSVFVTSFTTAAAFLANVVSDITAIQCFGIFAALSIAANFVMMISFVPAVVVASEACSACVTCPCDASTFGVFYEIPQKVFSWLAARFKSFFHTAIPTVIRRTWWLYLAVGVVFGLAALVIVFYKPALKPPTSKEFQLFNTDNILEKWDLDFKHRFPVEIAAANEQIRSISVTILFGFKTTDPGNRLDPNDRTIALSRDGDFDMERSKTQDWLRQFCDSIKRAAFARVDINLPCVMSNDEMYRLVVEFACSNVFNSGSLNATAEFKNICCLNSVNSSVLIYCVNWSRQLGLLDSVNSFGIRESTAGCPIYNRNTNDSSFFGYVFKIPTSLDYSMSYENMRNNYDVLSTFMNVQLKSAPDGLSSGFFVTDYGFFDFYDLQHSLATGTILSVGLSIGVSFLVLLITVRNVLITIYAMVTIVLSIACTVGSIVLMGWKLNIIESMTITLAVGMSIDFTIHYGVAYQLSRDVTSAGRTIDSVVRVGSAVAAGAWATFCAGIAVLNCSVNPYRKLGIFLVLVMVFSWVYSTFFFLSLCHIIGPVKNVCQVPCPTLPYRRKYHSSVANVDLSNVGAS